MALRRLVTCSAVCLGMLVHGSRVDVSGEAAAHVQTRDDQVCTIAGAGGSGATHSYFLPKAKCKFKCKMDAIHEKDGLFAKAFSAVPRDGKCACTVTEDVQVKGSGKISWEQANIAESQCTPKQCWVFYKSAYDVGRPRREMLGAPGPPSWKGTCAAGELPAKAFSLGDTVFYHLARQADKEPEQVETQTQSKVSMMWPPPKYRVVNPEPAETLVFEDAQEDTKDVQPEKVSSAKPIEVHVQPADEETSEILEVGNANVASKERAVDEIVAEVGLQTILNTVDLSSEGDNSDAVIQKVAGTMHDQVEILEDPWSGWDNYLNDIGKACNVNRDDLKSLQANGDWSLAPEKLRLASVCEADANTCSDALDAFPGMQTDGCADGDCVDALDKMGRLFVSFAQCKVARAEEAAEALAQSAVAAIEETMNLCITNKEELLGIDITDVHTSRSDMQLPKVCAAAGQCEHAITDNDMPKCDDPRCDEAQHLLALLIWANSQCKYLEGKPNSGFRSYVPNFVKWFPTWKVPALPKWK